MYTDNCCRGVVVCVCCVLEIVLERAASFRWRGSGSQMFCMRGDSLLPLFLLTGSLPKSVWPGSGLVGTSLAPCTIIEAKMTFVI